MKILTLCFIAVLMLLTCVSGPPHLELTAVQTPGPYQVAAYFSEPVSALNNETSFYKIKNASTGEILLVQSVSINDQSITLGLQAPCVLTAGHVYNLHYDVMAKENSARAIGTKRFLADFYPPAGMVPSVKAWHDSSGNTLLLWTPDNRIGNTAVEVWRKTVVSRKEDSSRCAVVEPNRSAFWIKETDYSVSYAVKTINEFGQSPLGTWVFPKDAGISVFGCINACVRNLPWDSLPANMLPGEITCDRVEYYNDSAGRTLVREITEKGIVETSSDSSGTTKDTLGNICN